jgi:hypothetical protein
MSSDVQNTRMKEDKMKEKKILHMRMSMNEKPQRKKNEKSILTTISTPIKISAKGREIYTP